MCLPHFPFDQEARREGPELRRGKVEFHEEDTHVRCTVVWTGMYAQGCACRSGCLLSCPQGDNVLSLAQCLTVFWARLMTAPRVWMCYSHWRIHNNLHGNLSLTNVRLPGPRMLPDLPQDSSSLREEASSFMGWCGCQPRGLGQAWGMQLAPAHQIPKEQLPP